MTKLHDYVRNHDHIIWDWNGTLLNDLKGCVTTINQVLSEWNLHPISEETYKAVFGFPVMKYYEKIGFDFSKHDWEKVAARFIEIYKEEAKKSSLFHGVENFLKDLKKSDKRLSILSASHEKILHDQLQSHNIAHLFDGIYGLNNHYATSKVERGQELIREIQVPREKTLLIGDTDHDMDVARELGIDVLIIADGHQSYERLSTKKGQVLKSRY